MPTPLEDAWAQLHASTPPGWFVGRPAFNEWLNPDADRYGPPDADRYGPPDADR